MKRTILILMLMLIPIFPTMSVQAIDDITITPCPGNETVVCPCTNCINTTVICVTVTHETGKEMDISFWSNWSGSWTEFDNNQEVTNGTYCTVLPVDYNTTYYWFAVVSETDNPDNEVTSDFIFTTNSSYNCTETKGKIIFTGIQSAQFLTVAILVGGLAIIFLKKRDKHGYLERKN